MQSCDEKSGSSVSGMDLGGLVLRIGTVDIAGRALLAPMSGVTDVGMRVVASRFGAAATFSEMVASDGYLRGETESRLRAEGADLYPHVVQLAGCEPRPMGEAARLAEASGADIIDINMGCPAKRVTGGDAGSALMRDLDLALRLIDATVAAVSVPVTLKMRLGWDDANCNAPELARRAEAAGIAMVTVHARTRCQFYTGRARWPQIRSVKRAVRIPVVANGDCGSFADADRMLALSGADAVMVGRGAVGRPWFPGQLNGYLKSGRVPAEPSSPNKRDACLEHLEGLLSSLGAAKGLRHARKHLSAYAAHAASGRARSGQIRNRLVTSESPGEVRWLLTELFKGDDAGISEAA